VSETAAFDAALDVALTGREARPPAFIVFQGRRVPASFFDYGFAGHRSAPLARVAPGRPVDAKWMDPFELLSEDGRKLGRGVVLLPSSPWADGLKPSKRKSLLEGLSRGEREMILALAETKGIQGLSEDEVAAVCRLDAARIEQLARGLEEGGELRIFAFSPLSLVLQDSLDFLRRRVSSYIAQYLKKHPGREGASISTIEKRFALPRNILLLALRTLAKEGRVILEDGTARLPGLRAPLSGEDEKLLGLLESMILKGEFGAVSLDEMRRSLRISPWKLQKLLTVLTERDKIVKGKDGFLLHSVWLDELVQRIRGSARKELTVADFKKITGLSRKYAIPLLELLDEMGVTRRKGAVRDILR
jgi:selenocysteine-specific elongation factor